MTAGGGSLELWFRDGVAAARSGQRGRARELFRRVVQHDEEHVDAWLWLAGVAEGEEQEACVARVMALNGGAPALASAAEEMDWQGARPVLIRSGRQGAPPRWQRRLRAHLGSGRPGLAALGYLAAVTLAEMLTAFADPRLGLGLHCLMLAALFVQIARAEAGGLRALLLGLAFAPLIRILSLSLPLTRFPILYWYLITSLPLFVAAYVAAPVLGYRWRELGMTLRRWPLQVLLGLSGLALGAVEYFILRPEPLAPSLALAEAWWPALVLVICTGLLEEMVFRGLLQRAACQALGRWGLGYVALLFAAMHIGYQSVVDVLFVLAVGLLFGWFVERTRSLLGVTLAHGLTNVMLFLIMPYLVG